MSTIKQRPSRASLPYDQKSDEKIIVVEQKPSFKRFMRSTLFAFGSLYMLNALLLYFGTLSGGGYIDLARFYGFREGKNEHLQRTSGMLFGLMAMFNFSALTKLYDEPIRDKMVEMATSSNVVLCLHYLLETIYFKGLRAEILFVMGAFLVLNLSWTFKEIFFSQKKVAQEIQKELKKTNKNVAIA
jgi:hypothetical protein